jgi:hypothetical protein
MATTEGYTPSGRTINLEKLEGKILQADYFAHGVTCPLPGFVFGVEVT